MVYIFNLYPKSMMVGAILLQVMGVALPGRAQITLDNRTPTEIAVKGNEYIISGGTVNVLNVFHSFEDFSVNTGRVVTFEPQTGIENIINRVTGDSESFIDGEIQYKGSPANIFLLNPNGVVFGPGSRLDVNASFVASSADGVLFEDGSSFGVNQDSFEAPLLTSSIPVGLQLGQDTPGHVHVSSNAISSRNAAEEIALEVPTGRTLALVGGDVSIQGNAEIATPGALDGYVALRAPGGRLEVGSVASGETVDLRAVDVGWALDYDSVVDFQDVNISAAQLQTGSRPDSNAGAIHLQGNEIVISNNSQVSSLNVRGLDSGQPIVIDAKGHVKLNSGSSLTAAILDGPGKAGDIIVRGQQLSIFGGIIDSSSQGSGTGGRVMLDVTDMIELGAGFITTSGFLNGDAGSLQIDTARLRLFDDALISSSNFSTGNRGALAVEASEWIELQGGSSLRADTFDSETAGDLSVATSNLTIRDGGSVSVNSLGTGDAGALIVEAKQVLLTGGGILEATSVSGDGGDINIDVLNQLELRNRSSISTSAGEGSGGGDGGNININAQFITAIPNEDSDITANAFDGRGGNIEITAAGIFGIVPRTNQTNFSDITASSQTNVDGTISITSTNVEADRDSLEEPDAAPPPKVVSDCSAGRIRTSSSFVDIGRGGLPPDPAQSLGGTAVWEDLRPVVTSRSPSAVSSNYTPKPPQSQPAIVEAQGWIMNEAGEIVLTEEAPHAIASKRGFRDRTCRPLPQDS